MHPVKRSGIQSPKDSGDAPSGKDTNLRDVETQGNDSRSVQFWPFTRSEEIARGPADKVQQDQRARAGLV